MTAGEGGGGEQFLSVGSFFPPSSRLHSGMQGGILSSVEFRLMCFFSPKVGRERLRFVQDDKNKKSFEYFQLIWVGRFSNAT